MFIYYVLINNKLSYYESDEEMDEEGFKELFEGFEEKVEVYSNYCNFGSFDLIYSNKRG